jgi:hypothetical protein
MMFTVTANFLRRIFNGAGDDIPPLAPLSVWTSFTIQCFKIQKKLHTFQRQALSPSAITRGAEKPTDWNW